MKHAAGQLMYGVLSVVDSITCSYIFDISAYRHAQRVSPEASCIGYVIECLTLHAVAEIPSYSNSTADQKVAFMST